jgi:hypothetical protein
VDQVPNEILTIQTSWKQIVFKTVIANTGNWYFAADLIIINGNPFRPTDWLDASFGQDDCRYENGEDRTRDGSTAWKKSRDCRGPIEHDPTASWDAARDIDIAVFRFDTDN